MNVHNASTPSSVRILALCATGILSLHGPATAQCPGGYGGGGGGGAGAPPAGPSGPSGPGGGFGPRSPSAGAPAAPAPGSPGTGRPGAVPRSPGSGPAGPSGGGAPAASPTPAGPEAPPPPPMGQPRTPLSGSLTPTAFDLGELGDTRDPYDWQLWWVHNRDRYLTRERFRARDRQTSGDDFYLGRNQRDAGAEKEAARQSAIDTTCREALGQFLSQGGPNSQLVAALQAAGNAEIEALQRHVAYLLGLYLRQGLEEPAAASALALGATADTAHVPLLLALLRDDAAARQHTGGSAVPESVRALSVTAVGLLAGASFEAELRAEVVDALAAAIVDATLPRSVQVAATEALGFVPLELAEGAHVCYCGECARAAPSANFQSQVTFVLEHVAANRDYDPLVRAQAVSALGRLIGARLGSVPEEIKRGAVAMLTRALDPRAKQPSVVREAAVLALGLVADADHSFEDNWARWAIERSAKNGGKLERRYALMALAQSGARRGQSEAPFAATLEIERELVHQLTQGPGDVQSWAALALGVIGHGQRSAGQMLSPEADLRLMAALARSKRTERGAVALALGLRGASERSDALVTALERERDVTARCYLALALGLAGAEQGAAPLVTLVQSDETDPRLRLSAGLALGLLGEGNAADTLAKLVADRHTDDDAVRAAAEALGHIGDLDGAEALAKLVIERPAARGEDVLLTAIRSLGRMVDRRPTSWRNVLANGGHYHARTTVVAKALDVH